jgi:hypothetical protein
MGGGHRVAMVLDGLSWPVVIGQRSSGGYNRCEEIIKIKYDVF